VCLTLSEAHCHFKRTLKGSKWERIKGFHTFRHSFASNLANGGVDQRIIDEWMGHQTEEMRRRYRHLFPEQQRKAIDSVFGGNGK
jgi:integrase